MDWRRHRSALRMAAVGLLLSPGAPIGLWALTEWLEIGDALRLALIYSGVSTAIVFTCFGAWAGGMMDRLREASIRDGLTELFNRRFLCSALPALQAGARRRSKPLALLMLDLDHFKRVNDRHGHLIGDQTLRAIAEVLRRHSRASDLVSRYGGEEFAIVCPDTTREIAISIAERLRAAVAAIAPEPLGHAGPQTVSIGIAIQEVGVDAAADELIGRADAALYRAKAEGRNRTVVWDEARSQSEAASASTSRA